MRLRSGCHPGLWSHPKACLGELPSSLPQLLVGLKCRQAIGTARQLMTWQPAPQQAIEKGREGQATLTQATLFHNQISEVVIHIQLLDSSH